MSGSSMDGLDIAYCTFEEIGGKWSFTINKTECVEFEPSWKNRLHEVASLNGRELLLTHSAFGHWMGNSILDFIERNDLHHKVHLIASHGHTVFHDPEHKMTFQMGDGAAIAGITKLPVVSDLRNMDIALGGQGAPIVPIGEKLLWNDFTFFLNLGGICNVTISQAEQHLAFDICPANRVLNLLSADLGKSFDKDGEEASKGTLCAALLEELDGQNYYKQSPPKSLSNEFGTEQLYDRIREYEISTEDKLHTLCIHIAQQLRLALQPFAPAETAKMLVTGGGAFNSFLLSCIRKELETLRIEVVIPEEELIGYKEAMIMGLIGVLRWREEINVLSSVTGSSRSSVGGALWMGQD